MRAARAVNIPASMSDLVLWNVVLAARHHERGYEQTLFKFDGLLRYRRHLTHILQYVYQYHAGQAGEMC